VININRAKFETQLQPFPRYGGECKTKKVGHVTPSRPPYLILHFFVSAPRRLYGCQIGSF